MPLRVQCFPRKKNAGCVAAAAISHSAAAVSLEREITTHPRGCRDKHRTWRCACLLESAEKVPPLALSPRSPLPNTSDQKPHAPGETAGKNAAPSLVGLAETEWEEKEDIKTSRADWKLHCIEETV